MSLKSIAAAVVLAGALAEPAMAGRLLGFERNVVVLPAYGMPGWYPPYAPYPYAPYGAGPYFMAPPVVYGPPYGANWRDNWYDATRTKVHGYTLR